MITAHSLRKASPTLPEQLAPKEETPNNRKSILLLLGMAAVIAYFRSFFTNGQALGSTLPAPEENQTQPSGPAESVPVSKTTATEEPDEGPAEDGNGQSGSAPEDDILPVSNGAIVFQPTPYLAAFEITSAGSASMPQADQITGLNPLAFDGPDGLAGAVTLAGVPVAAPPAGTVADGYPNETFVPQNPDLTDGPEKPAGGTGTGGSGTGGGTGTGTGGTGTGGGTDTGGGTGGTNSGGTGTGGGTGGGTDTGGGTGGTGTDGGTGGGTDTGGGTGGGAGGTESAPPETQPALVGTGISDRLVGTVVSDQIFGQGGDDNIDAGDGNDYVDSGAGDDLIAGRSGTDTLLGGDGDDVLDGGTGDDILYGQDGSDRLFGLQGDDVLFGGAGSDALFGGTGADALDGGDQDDILAGDEGDDTLDGQAGDDRLSDGSGQDIVRGGDGEDWVTLSNDAETDTLYGGAGSDTLDLSSFDADLVIDLGAGLVEGAAALDRFSGFESIVGGSGDDVLLAGPAGMILAGGSGSDVFDFSAVSPAADSGSMAFFRITDFQTGDTLKLPGNLTLAGLSGPDGGFGFVPPEPTLSEMMGQGRDYTQDNGTVRLRFATDASDSLVHTVITADVDDDGIWDFEVSVDGWVPSDAGPQDFHLTQPIQP